MDLQATTATPPASPAERRGTAVDISRLLRPIDGPSPEGASLRYEPEFDRIREARRDEDPSLPQGVWRRDLKRADWNLVVSLCTDALAEQSKDLQIACWLTEALVYRNGLPGLATGLGLIDGLCDGFWPVLFPSIDENGDLGARIAPIEWLNDKAAQAIYTLAMTRSGSTEFECYSWTDYVNAQRRETARQDAATATTAAAVLMSAEATPTAFYEDLRDQIGLCLAALDSLKATLGRCCDKDEPSLGQIREALEHIAGFVAAALEERLDVRQPPAPAPVATVDMPEPAVMQIVDHESSPVATKQRIQIASREEAYRLLMEVADYLFLIEPHSPTPYIVQRAASWGMMPLHKLLVELTKGQNDLSALFELLGIGADGLPTRDDRG